MKNLTRFTMLVTACFVLAACASKDPAPVEPAEPMEAKPTRPAPEVQPAVDINDDTNPKNLDDPRSLLSRRVVYFDFDQSRIKPEYRDIIAAHATYLGANGGARITLEGHADERGTREYNLGLGERRGNAVSDLVDAQGASASQLSVVSYGEERPANNCSEERCWSQNRRVEIVYTSRQ
ncbi:MAG: peptidoglycan-associated lipoprotein Pal [Pseudomonadota bacterium]